MYHKNLIHDIKPIIGKAGIVQLHINISYWKEFTSLNIKNAETRNWGEIEVNHVPAIFVFLFFFLPQITVMFLKVYHQT